MGNSITNIAVHTVITNEEKVRLMSALDTIYRADPRSVVKQGVSSLLGRITGSVPDSPYRIIVTDAEYDCVISGCKNVLAAGTCGEAGADLNYVLELLTK